MEWLTSTIFTIFAGNIDIIVMIDINKIRVVPDFPTPGIQFFDITTILNDATEYQNVFQELLQKAQIYKPDVIIGLEARGYYFAPALALEMGLPFVPIRKKGKLPFHTFTESYDLEYGSASIEIHQDAFPKHQKVLLFDDILATGGTAQAAVKLIQKFDPDSIQALFLMELSFLNGREKLQNIAIESLLIV
ncbi:MAG: adenine phosphoribosyltransferase [Bacteroidetes bacterium]|nr:adenine phosphoribosyltransferase [Bacteroidota bacterium]